MKRTGLSARMVFAIAMVVAGVAFGAPMTVTTGGTRTISVSRDVRVVSVDSETDAVELRRTSGRSIVVVGKNPGKATLTLRTREGDEYQVTLHVVSSGSSVYELTREVVEAPAQVQWASTEP